VAGGAGRVSERRHSRQANSDAVDVAQFSTLPWRAERVEIGAAGNDGHGVGGRRRFPARWPGGAACARRRTAHTTAGRGCCAARGPRPRPETAVRRVALAAERDLVDAAGNCGHGFGISCPVPPGCGGPAARRARTAPTKRRSFARLRGRRNAPSGRGVAVAPPFPPPRWLGAAAWRRPVATRHRSSARCSCGGTRRDQRCCQRWLGTAWQERRLPAAAVARRAHKRRIRGSLPAAGAAGRAASASRVTGVYFPA
jgi:hypothetical protein